MHSFLLLEFYAAKLQPPASSRSGLHETHCHWNILDISCTNFVGNILVPFLVRCNFNLFKCWYFMFLPWSIQVDVFIWTHFLQMVIHFSNFMLTFVLSGNNVGNRNVISWGFCRHGQVNNWFCNISDIFIWWDFITSYYERQYGLGYSVLLVWYGLLYILPLHR